MKKFMLLTLTAVFLMGILVEKVKADNDDLAFRFIKSEPEIIHYLFECEDQGKINKHQFDVLFSSNLVNEILDPRDYCADLVRIYNERMRK